MPRSSFCILLFAALFFFAHASEFKRFALNQGRVNMRNLASSDSAERLPLEKYGENFAVSVNLGEEYMKNNGLTADSETALTVALYTNVTFLCRDCYEFKQYNCKELTNTCKADTSANLTLVSPDYEMYGGHPVNHAISIGSDTANPAWKLSTPATLFNANHGTETVIQKITSGRFYMTNFNTYGLLGLGIGGKAASNFQGGHPLFSVSMNSAGYGSLIFGKDSSLYDAKKTPMVLTADTNWTMKAKAVSFGNYSNSTYASSIVFDLQHPGIAIPVEYFDDPDFEGKDFHSVMKKSLSLTRYPFFCGMLRRGYAEFYHAYKGKLTDLPDLVFTLENGKKLTIPPSAYTRKSATEEDLYTILISLSNSIGNVNNPDQREDYTVIGWPILSHYYTIFEQETGSQPTITLYPTLATDSSSLSTSTKVLIAVAFLAFVAIAYILGQKKGAANIQKEIALTERNSSYLAQH